MTHSLTNIHQQVMFQYVLFPALNFCKVFHQLLTSTKTKGTSASKNNKHIRWFVIAFNYSYIYVQLKTDHSTLNKENFQF